MGKAKQAFQIEEVKGYLLIIGAAILVITANIWHLYENVAVAFQQAAFQVASIITTTGYATANFDLWPPGIQDNPGYADVCRRLRRQYRRRHQGVSVPDFNQDGKKRTAAVCPSKECKKDQNGREKPSNMKSCAPPMYL